MLSDSSINGAVYQVKTKTGIENLAISKKHQTKKGGQVFTLQIK